MYTSMCPGRNFEASKLTFSSIMGPFQKSPILSRLGIAMDWYIIIVFSILFEKIKKAPRLPYVEIGLSEQFLNAFGAWYARDRFLHQIIDNATQQGIQLVDIILSPLRLLTSVDKLTFNGVDYGDLSRFRTNWISDFPRPLESLVTLPRGALDPKEKALLENHAKAVEIFMDSSLYSATRFSVLGVQNYRRQKPGYGRTMAEKINTCNCLSLTQKRLAYGRLETTDRRDFEEFVQSKSFIGPVSLRLSESEWNYGMELNMHSRLFRERVASGDPLNLPLVFETRQGA